MPTLTFRRSCFLSGNEALLTRPSAFMPRARECRAGFPAETCRVLFDRDSWGSAGVLGVDDEGMFPLTCMSCGLRDFRLGGSFPSPVPGLLRLAVLAPTVALLLNVGVAGDTSLAPSSIGRGLLACAIASGPACCGRRGSPTPASTRLERTVTGSTFSFIRALRRGSPPPNTILCTLLYMRRQVWKAWDEGWLDKSCRYVWNSQNVSRPGQHHTLV